MEDLNYKMEISESEKERIAEIKEDREILFKIGSSDLVGSLFVISVIISILTFVSILPYLMADLTIQLENTVNLNWIKSIFIVLWVIGLISPFMYYLIYFGARQQKVVKFNAGINIYRILTVIGLYFLYISAVIAGLVVIMLLFSSFFAAIVFGAILGGIIYVYYRFIKYLIEFLENLQANIQGTYLAKADPERLFVYVLIGIGLTSFSFLYNLISGSSTDFSEIGLTIQNYIFVDVVSSLLSISMSVISYYVLRRIKDEYTNRVSLTKYPETGSLLDDEPLLRRTEEPKKQIENIDENYHMKKFDE